MWLYYHGSFLRTFLMIAFWFHSPLMLFGKYREVSCQHDFSYSRSIDISGLRSERLPFTAAAASTSHSWLISWLVPLAGVQLWYQQTPYQKWGALGWWSTQRKKSNVALYFNCRALSLQLYCAQISVTGLFSHLKPCKKETNCKDHTHWKFNQNQIGKDKLRSRSEPQLL